LELEVAQKDIELAQLKEHTQRLETQLLGDSKIYKRELEELKNQLHAEVD
jgi:hypothetical protein